MATREQVLTKIRNALNRKTGENIKPCALCGHDKWILADRFLRLSAQKGLGGVVLGGDSFAFAVLVCANCGNSHFLNLMVLGFKDFTDLTIEEDASGTG